MSLFVRVLGSSVISLFLSVTQATAVPPVEAFGNLPEFSSANISPDGKHLAVVRPLNGVRAIAIYDVTNLSAFPHVVAVPDAVAESVFWPNNDRLIGIFRRNQKEVYSKDVEEWSRAVSVDVKGANAVVLLHNLPMLKINTQGAAIVDTPQEDTNFVYMIAYESWRPSLFKVNVATGDGELVMRSPENTIVTMMDGHGHPFGHIEQYTDLKDHIFIGGREVAIFDTKGGSAMVYQGLGMGIPAPMLVTAPGTSGISGLYTLELPNGIGKALFQDAHFDVNDVIYDEHSQKIIGVTYADEKMRAHYFDPAMQHIQDLLESAMPEQSVSILSEDLAGKLYVVSSEGAQNPPTLSIFDRSTMKVSVFLSAYPALKAGDLGEMKPYPYKARDGLDIHAYLTLPPGKAQHNLPTVVMPHGGPEDRDMLRFDWVAQFLASRGYAVLQPNFRGSSGYGWPFVKAGDGQWANKVQFDVQDGLNKLIADGVADSKRTCIFGWSYGGYMSLAGATFTPDLYACAAAFAGVYDLDRLNYSGSKFESEGESVWERRMGASRSDSDKMNALSPSKHADRVKAPVLLMHSDKDVTVPIEQSEIEERSLKSAGKQVQFVRMTGDDHQLSYAPTRIQMLTELEKFLAANIGH